MFYAKPKSRILFGQTSYVKVNQFYIKKRVLLAIKYNYIKDKSLKHFSIIFYLKRKLFLIFCMPPLTTLSCITAVGRLGIFFTRVALYWVLISFTQTSFIVVTGSLALDGCFSATLFFM